MPFFVPTSTAPTADHRATMATMRLKFSQVDVFHTGPCTGNPLAVVHNADGLSDEQMQSFANWTNLSETTFLLNPTHPDADYRVRIFTPHEELPFAGHPTLGSAYAHQQETGSSAERLVQECEIGLVEVRVDSANEEPVFAFQAPELIEAREPTADELQQALAGLGRPRSQVRDAHWLVNGPEFLGILLDSVDTLRAVKPDYGLLAEVAGTGIGLYSFAQDEAFDAEVRALIPGLGEDPVTGSLNAGFAKWLGGTGRLPDTMTVRQGTMVGRRGEVRVSNEDGEYWIGGRCQKLIEGNVAF